ncbi:MAG TPA: AzlC family ABC transporter permease [Acidimicrobiia bacterium]|jgi:predicted branched-subunit amino acid permease|nr:AzlC family ABC transporter permease [Acidimicrobiia bacterium]
MSVDRAVVRRGIIDALPLYVPAMPFALVIGLAIVESGINPFVGWSGSWLIFGGAAQLTVVTLLGSGAAGFAIVTAALVIQARHLMYSAALAPAFQRQPPWFRWLGPYFLIDQIFALNSLETDKDPKVFRTYYLASALTLWVLWQVTTAAGLALGPVVPEEWNLEFAVPLLFVALLVLGLDSSPKLAAAMVGAAVTWLTASMPNRTGLLIGSLAGIAVGALLERSRKR